MTEPAQPPPERPAMEGLVIEPPPKVEGIIGARLDLPSGGWVDFRDPTQLRAKDRRDALATVPDDTNKFATALDMGSALGMMLVEKFGGIPYPPFSNGTYVEMTATFLDELTMPDYDAIVEHVAPAVKLLFPGASTVDNRKPGSPTPPVAD